MFGRLSPSTHRGLNLILKHVFFCIRMKMPIALSTFPFSPYIGFWHHLLPEKVKARLRFRSQWVEGVSPPHLWKLTHPYRCRSHTGLVSWRPLYHHLSHIQPLEHSKTHFFPFIKKHGKMSETFPNIGNLMFLVKRTEGIHTKALRGV